MILITSSWESLSPGGSLDPRKVHKANQPNQPTQPNPPTIPHYKHTTSLFRTRHTSTFNFWNGSSFRYHTPVMVQHQATFWLHDNNVWKTLPTLRSTKACHMDCVIANRSSFKSLEGNEDSRLCQINEMTSWIFSTKSKFPREIWLWNVWAYLNFWINQQFRRGVTTTLAYFFCWLNESFVLCSTYIMFPLTCTW